MKIFIASISITCEEYGFNNNHLLICEDINEAKKRISEYINEENLASSEETYYKLQNIETLEYLDGYKIDCNIV